MKLSIIIPVYNEERAVANTISRIQKVCTAMPYETEIIAVNDGSTDKTLNILKKIQGIKLVNNPYNLGYGASLKRGIRASIGDWIVITDSDGTYPIEDIPKLVSDVPEYDMVVGARIGKHVHIPIVRKFGKLIVGKIANFLSGKNIPDLNSGLRVFNKAKALEFMKLYPSGFSFTTTITLAFLTSDYPVKFVSINYHKREGKSKLKPKEFVNFIALIFRIIMHFKPLKFFAAPSLSLMLAGIIYGAYQIKTFSGIGEFPLLLIVIGALTLLMGFMADALAKK